MKKSYQFLSVLFLSGALFTIPAFAGQPVDWQMGFQEAASDSAQRIDDFHNMLLWIISIISVFVLALLLYVIVRFNSKANPTPKIFSHNVTLEIIWTVVPVIILLIIIVPSFRLLYQNERLENPDMSIKVTGFQWYWGYEYPDHDGLNFMSYMIADEDIDPSKGEVRLLSTDTKLVLPIDTNIQILVTSQDVLHAWAVPALGIKIDAVPGRLNETWVRINKEGVYYGQCSELCGKDHAYMPVEVHAVSKEAFQRWLVKAKKEFAYLPQKLPGQTIHARASEVEGQLQSLQNTDQIRHTQAKNLEIQSIKPSSNKAVLSELAMMEE